MVGPVSEAERESVALKVKLAIAALVGISAGLVTLQGDPGPMVFGGAVVGGFVVGALLVWYIFPGSGSPKAQQDQQKRDRF